MRVLAEIVVVQAVGTSGVTDWVKGNVVGLLILLAGIAILWKSKLGDNAAAAKAMGPLALGLIVIGIALTGTWEPIARWAAGLFD